jgi:hypothetical protein
MLLQSLLAFSIRKLVTLNLTSCNNFSNLILKPNRPESPSVGSVKSQPKIFSPKKQQPYQGIT